MDRTLNKVKNKSFAGTNFRLLMDGRLIDDSLIGCAMLLTSCTWLWQWFYNF